ncbi:MAG: pteridine reductase [Pseudomonadota bacterium]|nr:pteridine reductase [Pseudomonadota bacterium]
MQNTTPDLLGKTALITGAARRVGAVIARTLHTAGMNVVIHYRGSRDAAERLRDALETTRPDSVELLQADLLYTGSLPDLATQAHNRWGRLDVLVNNASSFYPTPVGEITETSWDELVGSNLKAPLFLTQAAAPLLAASQGCVINMVDIHADRPLKNYTVYSIAKAGLVSLTKSMARELGPDVRVNAIAPGAILWPEREEYADMHREITERTALKRQGEPGDIARTALFLVRDAGYITGQVLAVDGGRTLGN